MERPAKASAPRVSLEEIGRILSRLKPGQGWMGVAVTECLLRHAVPDRHEPSKRIGLSPPGRAMANLSAGEVRPTVEGEMIRRVSELASSLTRNQMPSNGLGVRIPCPPL